MDDRRSNKACSGNLRFPSLPDDAQQTGPTAVPGTGRAVRGPASQGNVSAITANQITVDAEGGPAVAKITPDTRFVRGKAAGKRGSACSRA